MGRIAGRDRGGRVWPVIRDRLFVLYLPFNMLVCAVLFLPWCRRRETVCGLLGRWRDTGTGWQRTIARPACPWLDRLFHRNWDHCRDIWRMEEEARNVLYPPRD